MRDVAIVGIGQIPVQKQNEHSLRKMGATAVKLALADAGVEQVDALFAANMLADELQGQKHLATLIADEAGLVGIEALQIRAATAAGAAALRIGYLTVASGQADCVVVVGVEKMSSGVATPALAKALDSELEIPYGATMVTQNALLLAKYREKYAVPEDGLTQFPVVAHQNALHNPFALFHKEVTPAKVMASRMIHPPLRLMDCSPICDGAAAVVIVPAATARDYTQPPVKLLASAVATDHFRVAERPEPLSLQAARLSAAKAYQQAGVTAADITFFELHDAFSIMACLLLEAAGFASPGCGWEMAAMGETALNGRLPLTTFGGLKARGHPIGATALYQTCEMVLQMRGRAGANQIANPELGMMQSVGGAATTLITHILTI